MWASVGEASVVDDTLVQEFSCAKPICSFSSMVLFLISTRTWCRGAGAPRGDKRRTTVVPSPHQISIVGRAGPLFVNRIGREVWFADSSTPKTTFLLTAQEVHWPFWSFWLSSNQMEDQDVRLTNESQLISSSRKKQKGAADPGWSTLIALDSRDGKGCQSGWLSCDGWVSSNG